MVRVVFVFACARTGGRPCRFFIWVYLFFWAMYSPRRMPCSSPMRIPRMYCFIMLSWCCMLVVGVFEVFSVCACVE